MIKIADVVEWDDKLGFEEQSPMAQAWYLENVQYKLNLYSDGKGNEPVRDKYGRPMYWNIEFATFTLKVQWNYQKADSNDWTKGKDTITFKIK